MVGRMEGFTTAFARSRRPASMARCTGSSGGFAPHRRDPLEEAHREILQPGRHVSSAEAIEETGSGPESHRGTGDRAFELVQAAV